MILYALIMAAAAIPLLGVAIALFRGNPGLIMEHHQANVKPSDRPLHRKAIAKGLLILGAAMPISGILPLLMPGKAAGILSLGVLAAGLAISLVILIRAQKKYNGGFFD